MRMTSVRMEGDIGYHGWEKLFIVWIFAEQTNSNQNLNCEILKGIQ